MFSKLREPVSGLTHLGGALAAVGGQVALLIISWDGVARIISALVYGISLILLFSASASYHLVNAGPKVTKTLRKLDHSAIFLLIAGTYTPICINAFSGFFRWGLLAIIWGIAIVGILVKLFYINAPRWLSAAVYVLMGWLAVSAFGEMGSALSPLALTWLIIGGVVYTLGAIVYAAKLFDFVPGKFGFHEVWHIFVLLGAAAHFVTVMAVLWPSA